jgi:hypothetical protein
VEGGGRTEEYMEGVSPGIWPGQEELFGDADVAGAICTYGPPAAPFLA